MANFRSTDMLFLDDLLEMHGGYVLDFSDRTFSAFFAEELDLDIDDDVYKKNGTSKGKRMRCFLQNAPKDTVVKALYALWDYREAVRMRHKKDDEVERAQERLQDLIGRLTGQAPKAPAASAKPALVVDREKVAPLQAALMALSGLEPQPRGYAFEKFLKDLFDAFGLEARDAFRVRGEQIDGSFYLGNETYLLEAKWQNPRCDAADLRNFNAKVEDKAAWSRGLFISYSGFTADGLAAFGRGKRVICMDGFDLHEVLSRGLVLNTVLERKGRRFAETGNPYVQVRDLFPA